MAIYEVKKEGGMVIVTVSVPALPNLLKEARKVKEVVRVTDVKRYLKSQGIDVIVCTSATVVSNLDGPASNGEFVFSVDSPKEAAPPAQPTPEKKSLTNEAKSAIIDHSAKTTKRKRSKDGSTSNKTEDTSE